VVYGHFILLTGLLLTRGIVCHPEHPQFLRFAPIAKPNYQTFDICPKVDIVVLDSFHCSDVPNSVTVFVLGFHARF